MTKYIAFLRAINAGITVKMIVLKKIFEDIGLQNVQTVMATGNVIFETNSKNGKSLEQKIENSILKELDFKTPTVVLTAEKLKDFFKLNPFKEINKTKERVPQLTFLKNDPGKDLKLKGQGYEILGIINNVVCSVVDLSGATTPDLLKVLEKEFGKEQTTRNWKTIEKVVNKLV